MLLTTEHFPLTAVAEIPKYNLWRGSGSTPVYRGIISDILTNESKSETATTTTTKDKLIGSYPQQLNLNWRTKIQSAVLSIPMAATTSIPYLNRSSNEAAADEVIQRRLDDDYRFFALAIVATFAFIIISLISVALFMCLQKRKKFDELRHHLIPVYNFTPDEEEEWGVLLDEKFTQGSKQKSISKNPL